MYLETANTFINLKDVKTMFINERSQIVIMYINDSSPVTVTCRSNEDAVSILLKLIKKAEEVQCLDKLYNAIGEYLDLIASRLP